MRQPNEKLLKSLNQLLLKKCLYTGMYYGWGERIFKGETFLPGDVYF